MRKLKKITSLVVFILSIFLVNIHAGEIKKTFKNIKEVRFKGMNSDCVVKKAAGNEVTVHLVYRSDSDYFKPQIKADDGTLVLRDMWHDGEECVWTITVPSKTAVKLSSVSGDFSIEGLDSDIDAKTVSGDMTAADCKGAVRLTSASGEFEVKNLEGKISLDGASSDMKAEKLAGEIDIQTASGDIEAIGFNGEISLKAASGDIEIEEAKGEFKVKTASGDINASDISIQKESQFKVASGDVEIILAESAAHDLTLASASGDAVLDYNGNPIKGWFELTALVDDGMIISPFKFDKEEIEEKWGKRYAVKSFKKESDSPKIYIKTATGKAVLKK
jgi:DUF4097 and DUF4098 domain-containing protein YvlB